MSFGKINQTINAGMTGKKVSVNPYQNFLDHVVVDECFTRRAVFMDGVEILSCEGCMTLESDFLWSEDENCWERASGLVILDLGR